jgi:hypothetical protein
MNDDEQSRSGPPSSPPAIGLFVIMALPAAVFLVSFSIIYVTKGRTLGPNHQTVHGLSQMYALRFAPISAVSYGLALVFSGERYLRAGWWVGLALLGGFVALKQLSLLS